MDGSRSMGAWRRASPHSRSGRRATMIGRCSSAPSLRSGPEAFQILLNLFELWIHLRGDLHFGDRVRLSPLLLEHHSQPPVGDGGRRSRWLRLLAEILARVTL